jgi:phage tail P2-like protein
LEPIVASYVLAGTIEVNPDLVGTIRVDRANRYTPEDRKESLGYRPSLPLLVNSMNVKTVADIAAANVAEEGHFIISPLFTGGAGDTLYDQGAKPGSIGTKTLRGVTTIYVFRTPYENEVVWYVVIEADGDIHELGFHRWDGETWQPYKTWPERALEGMQAFEVLDPDRIWEYYARVIGATQAEWTVDARAMLDFLDPDRCPLELLPELAGNFGLILDATEQEAVQRQKVRDAIPTYKLKGLPLAVELRLRSLGYTGYSREIWVNPDNPNNYTDDNTGEKGTDYIEVIHGSRYRVPRIGLLFVGAEQPSDGEIVTIDDYTTSVTFEFEISGGVGGGNTPVAVGADAYETLENLIAAVNASALTLEASETPLTDWPEMSLDGGKVTSDSIIIKTFNHYFPSSRVSIHINRLAGQPLSMTLPASALEEFEQFIATQLGEDVLPAPIDIRFFATDIEASGDGEELEVADTLVLTEIP